jgi:hypothetical protein
MKTKLIAIVVGPKEYLPEGIKVELFEVAQDDIDCFLEEVEEETEEDAIQYYKEEYIAEWEQRWCQVMLLTEEEFKKIKSIDFQV